jgi:hypothetical protein
VRTSAGLATLLRVFARPGDRLWLPAPVDPERIPYLPAIPSPAYESGPPPPSTEVLAWCETPTAAELRTSPRPSAIPWDAPLHDLVWSLPVPSPRVVAEVHHRAFHLRVAEELGCALPGARRVSSLAELDAALAARDAPRSWVVKAPLSASGRARYIERGGPALSDPKARRTVENLLERQGELLFEPWMDRVEDFGCAAIVTPEEIRLLGAHRQIVDVRGQFAGVELLPRMDERLAEVVHGVALALRRAGYAGPFGIDAWTYRKDGETVLHPLGEINARLTFGIVARALAERTGARRLRFGREIPQGEGILPLLLPGGDGASGAAWAEVG